MAVNTKLNDVKIILQNGYEMTALTSKTKVSDILEENNIKYEYNKKVEYIQNNDKTGMCPMENKFKEETDLMTIYDFFVKEV